jgi:hypothetical protein
MVRWVIFLIGLSLVLCGCATHTTHHTLVGTDLEPHRHHVGPSSDDLPTPQLIMLNADIVQGRRTTVRLHQSPAWNSVQNRGTLADEVDAWSWPDTPASQVITPPSDKVLQAINAAFERAQRNQEPQQPRVSQQWHWSVLEARFDALDAGR